MNSFKEASRAEITKHIITYGKTVLVATDVHNPPKMVKKMASALNSKIYAPYRDLAVNAKNELVDDYIYLLDHTLSTRSTRSFDSELVPNNAHERDALAAAIQGYKKYQKKMEQIERKTEKLNFPLEWVDDIKIMVINEVPITKAINATLERLKPSYTSDNENIRRTDFESGTSLNRNDGDEKIIESLKKDVESETTSETISKLKNKLKSQDKQIRNLQKKNSTLEEHIQEYQDEISNLETKISRLQYQYSHNILRQKEIATKTSIIKGLQQKYNHEKVLRKELEDQLQSIKRIRAMELSREALPVKIIDNFSKDGIREATASKNIKKSDVVLLKSSKGGGPQTASLLIHLGVKAVITTDKMSHQAKEEFQKNMIPLIEEKKVDLKMADDVTVIMSQDLKREIEQWKKEQEEKKKKEDRNKLLKIMDDYRAQRKRSTNNY